MAKEKKPEMVPAEKKTESIRIRVDAEMKMVLNEMADRDDRTEQDEARHLLRIALGLKPSETRASEKKTAG